MGASYWDYLTPYRGTPQRTLDALRQEVFASGRWIGAGGYETLDELWADDEFMTDEGTHSVLDVIKAVPDPGLRVPGTVHPLRPARLVHHFGTDRPTVAQYVRAAEDRSLQQELDVRGAGVYILLHTDGEPTHVGFFGVSGD
ncbi:hypothetical protein ACFC6L_05835 [Kitasatospora phosalacinea]|uniref:hypothetical protein n=1 Tax=Kitasatospora phosalacinea TaxID=2065 RepID=UPI0035DBCB3E